MIIYIMLALLAISIAYYVYAVQVTSKDKEYKAIPYLKEEVVDEEETEVETVAVSDNDVPVEIVQEVESASNNDAEDTTDKQKLYLSTRLYPNPIECLGGYDLEFIQQKAIEDMEQETEPPKKWNPVKVQIPYYAFKGEASNLPCIDFYENLPIKVKLWLSALYGKDEFLTEDLMSMDDSEGFVQKMLMLLTKAVYRFKEAQPIQDMMENYSNAVSTDTGIGITDDNVYAMTAVGLYEEYMTNGKCYGKYNMSYKKMCEMYIFPEL